MITMTDQSSVTQNNLMLAMPLNVVVNHHKRKSISTRFHIPGMPEEAKEGITHVRVRTAKNLDGRIVCEARAVRCEGIFEVSSYSISNHGKGDWTMDLCTSDSKATDKALLTVHTRGLAILREKRPDLFYAGEQLAQVEADRQQVSA
jgi:hypothetical protein